jgi:hypothetical protein
VDNNTAAVLLANAGLLRALLALVSKLVDR